MGKTYQYSGENEPQRNHKGWAAIANKSLQLSSITWLAVALAGQWAFFYYIAAFYGTNVITGNFEAWSRMKELGGVAYIPGDALGNRAFAGHALAAGIIAFGGALQLIPAIRKRAPAFHRWNGRIFLITVIGLSLSGYYLAWFRSSEPIPNLTSAVGTSINGLLILTFAALTLRTAVGRDFASHHHWAIRLYLVSNAQWFLRIGMFTYFVVAPTLGVQQSPDTFFRFWTFGCYLVPLVVAQVYFYASGNGGAAIRLMTASLLFIIAALMVVGIGVFAMFSNALITGAPLEI
ncbi:MAG: DUF2306 domain-containing protein [Myxococcales bacterium]|nr:DUF2306 domain-containing protein [Myxococcales bacterium]